jgi:hypothetical protein
VEAIVAAISGLAGALIGGWLTYIASRQAWRRTLSADVIDDIADVYDIAWHELDHAKAKKLEYKVRSRLLLLRAEQAQIDELMDSAWACWKSIRDDIGKGAISSDDDIGLPSDLLNRFRSAQEAIAERVRK